jgi:hypothetical protein
LADAAAAKKKIQLSTKGDNASSQSQNYEGYFLRVKYESQSPKTIHLLDGDEKQSSTGKYSYIELGFTESENYVFTSEDDIGQEPPNLKPLYNGNFSSISIEESEPNTKKTINVKTGTTGDTWTDPIEITGQIIQFDIGEKTGENEQTHHPESGKDSKDSKTGVLLLYEKLQGGAENYRPQEDKRDDGYRWNFGGDFAPAMDIGGYFKINDGDDEVTLKMFGGVHDQDNPKLARDYDIKIDFNGNEVTLETEHQHNGDHGGPYVEHEHKSGLGLGSLIRKWVGFRAIGYNFNKADESHTRLMAFVDTDGLEHGNKPANKWKKIADWEDHGQYISDVKKEYKKYDADWNHGPPYGKYPYGSNNAQQTIRIDETNLEKESDLLWCFQINHEKPLSDLVH